ncbi:PREDICTED: uncharacterized protein LOC106337604 [Brassica oleracea var. oleracea]|uniref:Bromo domain-containing protein n=1 Tax=Brassica oleracea var. oleracea TaxID=109376 RepID=A0A0D3BVD2_BRAOL|nr:PREDICTED: uncharacterized protein LOC106337604 [Brassica oleracea var. oleracea]
MVMMTTKMASDWGTWEELLLGGAVLRHGTGDWTVVSEELRSHSLSDIFTPEICKAKYKNLRERYLGCKAWFEELKKKRVAELKAALLRSEDSIGSLESKLQSLKSESNEECHQNNYYDSSRTLSLEPPSPKSEGGGECTSKDTSKDMSSVGSFTQQELTTTNWSPQAKSEAAKEQDKKMNLLHRDIFESMYGIGVRGQVLPSMRKKRGKRKRKDCSAGKDVTEESDMLDSSTVDIAKEGASTSSTSIQSRGHGLALPEELMKIYNTIIHNECALVFRRRLDSQKRARYKKLVRRHMDLDTIKSRINGRLISSAKELFMDILLVANNAAIFYSTNTREHKSAVCLRDIVTKSLRHYLTEDHHPPPPHRSSSITTSTKVPVPPSTSKSPAVRTSVGVKKPRTGAHPLKKAEQDIVKTASSSGKKMIVPVAGKKVTAVERRRGRDGNKQVDRGLDSPALTGRKRTRVR